MSASHKQPKPAKPQAEPSPWTDPFQQTHDNADVKQEKAPKPARAGRKTDSTLPDEPTHDALSTIFNGH